MSIWDVDMNQNTDAENSEIKNSASKPPMKETLWKLFGILFYFLVTAGAVYHFILAKR